MGAGVGVGVGEAIEYSWNRFKPKILRYTKTATSTPHPDTTLQCV